MLKEMGEWRLLPIQLMFYAKFTLPALKYFFYY